MDTLTRTEGTARTTIEGRLSIFMGSEARQLEIVELGRTTTSRTCKDGRWEETVTTYQVGIGSKSVRARIKDSRRVGDDSRSTTSEFFGAGRHPWRRRTRQHLCASEVAALLGA